jgi:chemotaxis protein MotB
MGKKKEHPPCKEEKTNKWLVTFADVITLLMTFFIFLCTYATLETSNLEQVQAYLVSSLGIVGNKGMHDRDARQEESFFPTNPESHEDGKVAKKGQETLGTRLDLLARKWEADTVVDFRKLQPKVEMHLVRWMAFDPDSDVIPPHHRDFIDDLALVIRQHSCRVVVQGYSDDRSDIDLQDDEGYRVAASRALNVALYMIESGDLNPGLVTVESFGRYALQSRDEAPLERAKNRSVGFLISSTDRKDKK